MALGLPPESADPFDGLDREAARAYLEQRIGLGVPSGPCDVRIGELERVVESGHLRAPLRARCPQRISELAIAYSAFFEIDSDHRGIVFLKDARGLHVTSLAPGASAFTLGVRQREALESLRVFLAEGVRHIAGGLDHLLFLAALLLPIAAPAPGGGRPPTPRAAVLAAAATVTAFTLAHSVTLSLAVLDVLSLPERPVEILIAASIVVAAYHNLRPWTSRGPWLLALGFGLLHGLGFAGALRGIGLPPGARGLALFGFNLGVELGQLAAVLPFVPLLLLLSRWSGYRRAILQGGSMAIAWIASIWLLERALDLRILPQL